LFSTTLVDNAIVLDLCIDGSGDVVACGQTTMTIPVHQPYQGTRGAYGLAAWLAKISGATTTGPSLTITAITPTLAKAGDTVVVTVTSSVPLGPDPTLTIGGHAATMTSRSGQTFVFSRQLTGVEGSPTPTLLVTGVDLSGQTGSQ